MMAAFLYGFVPVYLRILLLMTLAGTVLTLCVLFFRVFVERWVSKCWEYRLWKVVLLGFLIPFSLFLRLPVSTPLTGMQNWVERTTAGIQEPVSVPVEPVQESTGPALESGSGENPVPVDRKTASALNWGAIVEAVPVAVSGVLLIYTVGNYLLFARKLKRSRREIHEEERKLYQRLAPKNRQPELWRSALVPTPMLVGVLHPAIYLPDRAYTESQLEHILCHELTHFRRGDVAIKWCGILLTSIHWFNPFAWITRKELDQICELSCDEAVISPLDTDQKQDYGNTLIEMAAQTRIPRQVVSAGVCEEKRNLKARLTAIMESKPVSHGALAFSAMLTVLALCTVTVLGATQAAGEIDPSTIVSCRAMSLEDRDRDGFMPFYDNFSELKTDKILPDAYTKVLVELVNAYGKERLSPIEEGARIPLGMSGSWIRLDCADGGYWMVHYTHGFICFSFNPLHFGEDEYETLLTYVDPEGNPVQTWVMDYAFDWPFRQLREDGTMPPQKQFSLEDIKIRAVVSLNRYCTVEEVNQWIHQEDIAITSVFLWTPGETGRMEQYLQDGEDILQALDRYLEIAEEAAEDTHDGAYTEDLEKFKNGEYQVFGLSVELPLWEVFGALDGLKDTGCVARVDYVPLGFSGIPSKPDGAP